MVMTSSAHSNSSPRRASVEEALLFQIASGSKEALAQLYAETKSAVYGFALSILKNSHDAEDIMQEAYIRIYANAHSYKTQGKPLAWILTIVRNLALMKKKKKKRVTTLPPEDWEIPDVTHGPDDTKLLVSALLNRLTDQERQIVILHSLTALKHREIAALLDLPLPTVLSKYHRALEKLKKSMKEEDPR